eukprot:TRINITY_DN7410_c0_g1_i3.p2 TRINITY_DN7410_c0_g1~~TRINITY_DN7410_c0_g1_i3.p2  ORF type:complete len:173 (+),score=29.80 TRINITY_DN7410_c0_g1_i3:524-1042(+)
MFFVLSRTSLYLKQFLDPMDWNNLSDIAGYAYIGIATIFTPLVGLFLGKIGLLRFTLGSIFLISGLIVGTTVRVFEVQVTAQVMNIVLLSSTLVLSVVWAVKQSTPDLIGTFCGMLAATCGLFQLLFNVALPKIISLLQDDLLTALLPYFLSSALALLSCILLSIRMWFNQP